MMRAARSLNDLADMDPLPEGLADGIKLRKNWSFSHLLDLVDEDEFLPKGNWNRTRRNNNQFENNNNNRHGRIFMDKAASLQLYPPEQQRQTQAAAIAASAKGSRETSDEHAREPAPGLFERFQRRLALEVLDVMKRARSSEEKERTLLLEDLFYNSSSMIEPQVIEKLEAACHADGTDSSGLNVFDSTTTGMGMAPDGDRQLVRFLNGQCTRTRFYFELVSAYLCDSVHGREVVQEMLPLCSQLWSHELFAPIFALLFHRWLLTHDISSGSIIRLNVFLRGTNQLFWFDLQHLTHRLKSVYFYVIESISAGGVFGPGQVAADSGDGGATAAGGPGKRKNKGFNNKRGLQQHQQQETAPSHLREDLARLICRFFFYYTSVPASVSDLRILLLTLPPPVDKRNGSQLVSNNSNGRFRTFSVSSAESSETSSLFDGSDGGSSSGTHQRQSPEMFTAQMDRFIAQLVKHLPQIKREGAVIQCLEACRVFSSDTLAPSMSQESLTKLEVMLQAFVSPGGPLFPTRKVRAIARELMDELFPNGIFMRKVLGMGVRLLQPLYWPSSVVQWAKDCVVDVISWIPVFGALLVTKKTRQYQ